MPPYLDPVNTAFVNSIAGLPNPHILGYAKAREALEGLQEHKPAADIITETIQVPCKRNKEGEEEEEDYTTPVVISRRNDATKPCPMVFYLHGGGWIMGSPASFAPLIEDLARQSSAAIVFPCYTLAPEKQYPFQFEQVYSVLKYLVCNGREHGLCVEGVVLAGDSAGGHMAIAMTTLAIQRCLPVEIRHMVLFYPVTDTHTKLPSYTTFHDAPFLPADTLAWMIDAFLPSKADRENGLTSPLSFLEDEVLARFPPTSVFLADVDPLVDEGRAFARRLQDAGVEVAVIAAEGQIHAFALVKPVRECATARAVVRLAASNMRDAFSGLGAAKGGEMY